MNTTSAGEKKNNFLSPHNQSKNTQSNKIEYLLFRPELCHAQGESIRTFDYILYIPLNTKSHHEFTKLLSNSSFVRGIQIHYDLGLSNKMFEDKHIYIYFHPYIYR